MKRSKSLLSGSYSTEQVTGDLGLPNYPSPSLKDGLNQFGYRPELFVPKWSLQARIVVMIFGISGLILSTRSRGLLRKGLGLFGISSLIRAITNLHVTDLIGWLANPSMKLKRTIQVNALVDDVYDFLSQFTNYARFMSYIREVEINEHGGLRWTVHGPGGLLLHWNTTLGKLLRNQTISWKSTVNSLIRNSGEIHLKSLPGVGTEITVELTYAPPIGALGYATVHFLGFDPKDKIDEDLQVLKNILEGNYATHEDLLNFQQS